ncbi:nesp035 [Neophasia sp. alphabaculovirus]|nr:nesp035 [Neophasia sp. alphabaculovirus]
MNLFKRCSQYTRIPSTVKTRFPVDVMSYVTVTLCAFGAVATGFLSTAKTFSELQFLQYWIITSLFVGGLINLTLFLHRRRTEAHELVFELKMLHSMYFGNTLVHHALLRTSQSAVSNMLVNNLLHCCALGLLLAELIVLLGHTLGSYSDYRYAKMCFVIIFFVFGALNAGLLGADNMATAPLCNDLLMVSFLTTAYMLTAIVWAARKEAAGPVLKNVQIMPFNDPPPPFASVEMEDFVKTKV